MAAACCCLCFDELVLVTSAKKESTPVATGAVDSKPRPSPPVVGNKRKTEGHASGKSQWICLLKTRPFPPVPVLSKKEGARHWQLVQWI